MVLAGRYAGKKAVVVKSFDEGSDDKKFPHALGEWRKRIYTYTYIYIYMRGAPPSPPVHTRWGRAAMAAVDGTSVEKDPGFALTPFASFPFFPLQNVVCGIDVAPRKVTRSMNKKAIKRRTKVKPFIKYVNYTHILPTRYVKRGSPYCGRRPPAIWPGQAWEW